MEQINLEELYLLLPEYVQTITKKRKGKMYNCPLCHSGAREHGTPAFNLYAENNTRCHCHSCGFDGNIIGLYMAVNNMEDTQSNVSVAITALAKMFGLATTKSKSTEWKPTGKLEKRTHYYKYPDGSIFGYKEIVSYTDGSKKAIWNLYLPEEKRYQVGLKDKKAPLYHADLLAQNPSDPVFVTEGEKDADTIYNYDGSLSTTIPNGAGFSQWLDCYSDGLRNREVIILTDNDDAGRAYGEKVARHAFNIAKSVKVIPITAIWKECPEKGDISDAFKALGADEAAKRLSRAVGATEFYQPSTQNEPPVSIPPPEKEKISYTVNCLLSAKLTPMEYIWYPYIPVGEITVMFAAGGTGKSFLTCGITADITAGRPLPNPYGTLTEVDPQNVLIISAEDNENILYQRLTAAGANIKRCFTIAPPNTQEELEHYQPFELPCDAHDEERIQALKEAIQQCHAKLVVIDPWAAYVGKDTDMNRANSVRAVTAELTVIAKELDCAFLIVAHVNKKAQADNANDAVAGSADLVNGARSALAVRTLGDEDGRVMIHTKCNYEILGKSVCYKIINQGMGKVGKFEWNGFCELTKEDLEDAARTGKKLKDIADDKEDEELNRQVAIDIIKDLAVSGKKINVTYIRFRKLIMDECGIDFLPSKPTRFMNSLISDLRKRGITLEKIGQKTRDDTTNCESSGLPYAGFVICCMTDGHLMAEAMPK